jgi:hypothetical protein
VKHGREEGRGGRRKRTTRNLNIKKLNVYFPFKFEHVGRECEVEARRY